MASVVLLHHGASFLAINRTGRCSGQGASEERELCMSSSRIVVATLRAERSRRMIPNSATKFGRFFHYRTRTGRLSERTEQCRCHGRTAPSISAQASSFKDGNQSLESAKIPAEDGGRFQAGNLAGAESDTVLRGVKNRPKRIYFDYGFQANFLSVGPNVPTNVIKLAIQNFGREWRALRRSYLFSNLEAISPPNIEGGPWAVIGTYAGRGVILFLRAVDRLLQIYDGLPELNPEIQELTQEQAQLREQLRKLTLSNEAVWERERSRPPVEAPWWILAPYYVLCVMLDVIFNKRPIQRFWFLETVARMPYFSYISLLHLYETLGWWRIGAEVRKVHFAEEWNEMHHLKIMESLGGDLEWGDRFFAQHAAFFYYWILNGMFLISPKVAYNFSELIESHAVDTYGQFVDENEELLKTLPPSPVAISYYESEDLYMFDEFQTSQLPESRRPKVDNLYDVFVAICGDEGEHVKTMIACQQLEGFVISPHRAKLRL